MDVIADMLMYFSSYAYFSDKSAETKLFKGKNIILINIVTIALMLLVALVVFIILLNIFI